MVAINATPSLLSSDQIDILDRDFWLKYLLHVDFSHSTIYIPKSATEQHKCVVGCLQANPRFTVRYSTPTRQIEYGGVADFNIWSTDTFNNIYEANNSSSSVCKPMHCSPYSLAIGLKIQNPSHSIFNNVLAPFIELNGPASLKVDDPYKIYQRKVVIGKNQAIFSFSLNPNENKQVIKATVSKTAYTASLMSEYKPHNP